MIVKEKMKIKQSVINTFNRVGIPYEKLLEDKGTYISMNRFSGERCETNALVAHLISWVYSTSNQYEVGNYEVKVSDFDRIRYFILEVDRNAYSTCID